MLHEVKNFDLESPLICEGIIGDGCGGGRLFLVEDSILKAYDPQTKLSTVLLENIYKPVNVSKKACVVSVECERELIEFNLSTMQSKTIYL